MVSNSPQGEVMPLADLIVAREEERQAELQRKRRLMDFISRAFAPLPNKPLPQLDPEDLTYQDFPPGRQGRFSF